MYYIIKILLILALELNIYHILGHAMGQIKWLPKADTFGGKLIQGFLVYHFIFFCIAFPCRICNGPLSLVTGLWLLVICGLVFIAIFCCRRGLLESYQDIIMQLWNYKLYFVPCFAMLAFLMYYVCINGRSDADAWTYIGEVTTMLDTNKLAGIDVVTGNSSNMLLLKRSFSLFGVNSAVLCNIFSIRPLIFCRTVRASIDIIFLSISTYELFLWVYRGSKHAVENAIMILMLSQSTLFLFTNTIYTSSTFLLFRTYEGKAYCSGTLVLMAIHLAIQFCRTNDMRVFFLVLFGMTAFMSISASATFIPSAMTVAIILSHSIVERRLKYIGALILSLFPNIMYIILRLSGFSGFHLVG